MSQPHGALMQAFCRAEDFDPATGVCAEPFWAPYVGVLPPLGATDAWFIAGAIAGCWAIGWKVRQLGRVAR